MRNVWWLSPQAICLAWIGLLLLAYLVPDSAYVRFANAPKYIDLEYVLTILAFFACFFCGSVFGFRHTVVPRRPRADIENALATVLTHRHALQAVVMSGLLTGLAYIVWFAPMMNTGSIAAIAAGAEGGTAGRLLGNQISGLTTLTQLGIANAILSAYALFLCGPQLTNFQRRLCLVSLVSVTMLAAFRSLAWAERLALIEVVVPVALIWLLANRRVAPRTLAVLPVAGLLIATFVFGVFEYFRSWSFYQNIYSSYWYFSIVRFVSYYLTSFNNGVLIVREVDPSWLPLNTLAFVFKFPFLPTGWFAERLFYGRTEPYYYALLFYGNPEFNTFSAPALVAQDFGRLLGPLVFGGFGYLSGKLYRLFLSGSLVGLLLYPFWFVGFLDLGRILYWSAGRAFPVLVFLLVCALLWRRRYRPRRRSAGSVPRGSQLARRRSGSRPRQRDDSIVNEISRHRAR